MTPRTTEEIKQEIAAFLPNLQKAAEQHSVIKPYIEDWSRIGSFLTREADVKDVLTKLNRRVKKRIRQMIYDVDPDKLVAGPNGKIKPPDGMPVFKALEDELEEVEARFGFNKGQQQWLMNTDLLQLENKSFVEHEAGELMDLPAGAPTLSGFVDPSAFRKILFFHGYHWIDPGAGGDHGAYTHRIQWYCIVEAANRVAVDKSYLQLFRALAHDLCVTDNGKKTLWDLLFDCFKSGSTDSPQSDTYRSPEILNSFLTNWNTLQDVKYSTIAQLAKNAKSRDELDWVNKAAGIDMQNVSTALGPTRKDQLIDAAVGTVLWTNNRVQVIDVEKRK